MTDIIFDRQNDEDILELLFAQRISYDRAELYNRIGWIMTILLLAQEICKPFIPDLEDYSMGICAILAIIIYIVDSKRRGYIEKGAKLKNLIDCILFEYPIDKGEKEKNVDYALELKSKNEDKYHLQTTHDGNDIVKGVKNWYTLCNSENHNEVILNCQKQNLWWNEELVKYYKRVLILCLTLILAITTISVYIMGVKITVLLAILVATILFRCLDALKSMYVYRKAMIQAHGKLDIVQQHLDKASLISLQKDIDTVRVSGFLIPDWLHVIYSVKLHRKRETLNSRMDE